MSTAANESLHQQPSTTQKVPTACRLPRLLTPGVSPNPRTDMNMQQEARITLHSNRSDCMQPPRSFGCVRGNSIPAAAPSRTHTHPPLT